MENLKISAGPAREKLQHLQELIQEQRHALRNGTPPKELAAQMGTLEHLVQDIQAEMALEKSARLSVLYEVSYSINASLDWRRTLQAVMDAVIRITEAERGMLLVINDENQLQVELTSTATDDEFSEADMRYSYSIVRQSLQQGKPVLTTNAQIDPRFQGSESIIAYGLRSILCVPLFYRGNPLGVIYIDNRARAGVFTEGDLAVLTSFGHQASIALSNAQKHKKTDQALSEKVRELTILQEMARDLNTSLNFKRVMERSIAWAVAAASAEAGALAIVSEEGLRWVARIGDVSVDEETALRSLYTRKPLMEKKRLVLPLLREGRPIGALYLTTKGRDIRQDKLEFVVRVTDNIAIAVENARLYEALRRANQAKTDFVSIVSHELRAPMTSIRGYNDMLRSGKGGALTPQQVEFSSIIARNVTRMQVLVRDLLDISRIEAGRLRLKPRPMGFKDALDEAREMVQEIADEKAQTLKFDVWHGLPRANADPDRLTQILTNLLSNAIKYTPEGGHITVRAWLPPEEPDFIRCAITDTGIGIKPEDQARLFNKFYRVDTPSVREQPGTGLGLVITKNLVEMQGGRIWVESESGKGSTFFITVPIAMPNWDAMQTRPLRPLS